MTDELPEAMILIIDDDVAVSSLLEDLLIEEGYRVEVASSLRAAREVLKVNEPDVILLDVQLPDGNGFDFCSQLQADARTADLPILLLSAVDRDPASVARGLDLGGYDFLRKPFRNVELLARIRVLVRLRKLQQRLIEQERERAMLATAGAAAHSLGQPLMAALGMTSLLLQTSLSEEQRQDLELVYGALQQMSETMRQIQEVQHYATQPYLDDNSQVEILDIEKARGPRIAE